MLSNFELVSQLYAFMQSVPALWTREAVAALSSGEPHCEQRGPETTILQFELATLEQGVNGERRYIRVYVFVTDASRLRDVTGSSKTPLSTTFLWYEDGEVDMPLAREIYEANFPESASPT